jgi:hypothetical protein
MAAMSQSVTSGKSYSCVFLDQSVKRFICLLHHAALAVAHHVILQAARFVKPQLAHAHPAKPATMVGWGAALDARMLCLGPRLDFGNMHRELPWQHRSRGSYPLWRASCTGAARASAFATLQLESTESYLLKLPSPVQDPGLVVHYAWCGAIPALHGHTALDAIHAEASLTSVFAKNRLDAVFIRSARPVGFVARHGGAAVCGGDLNSKKANHLWFRRLSSTLSKWQGARARDTIPPPPARRASIPHT